MPRKHSFVSPIQKQLIIDTQAGRCAYCDVEFTLLNIPELDHFVPWCADARTRVTNLFAVCRRCNACKNDKTFSTLAEVRAYIAERYPVKKCAQCGEMFQVKRGRHKYCSHVCRTRATSTSYYYRHLITGDGTKRATL